VVFDSNKATVAAAVWSTACVCGLCKQCEQEECRWVVVVVAVVEVEEGVWVTPAGAAAPGVVGNILGVVLCSQHC
jgi:hypothetical protein